MRLVRLLILIVGSIAANYLPVAAGAPYLVGYSLFGGHSDPAYIASHTDYIESMPFDGMMIVPSVGVDLFNSDFSYGNRFATGGVWTYQQCINSLAPLTPTTFRKFKQNFAVAIMGPDHGGYTYEPPDIFDDWSWVITSFQNYAKACRDVGIRGIWVDDEVYSYTYWSYPNDVKYKAKTLQDYVNQARLRSKQLMQAAVAVYPDIVVMGAHGPWSGWTTWDSLFYGGANNSFLMGAFDAGFADGSGPQSIASDGGEIYRLRTLGDGGDRDFEKAYQYRKFRMTDVSIAPPFMDSSLAAIWSTKMSMDFGTFDSDEGSSQWPLPVQTDMAAVRTYMANALRRADNYVWHYTQAIDWWRAPGVSGSYPAASQAWIDALAGARLDYSKTLNGSVDLTANGDFENGDQLWSTSGTVVFASANAHAGTRCAQLSADSSVYQDVAVQPNTGYLLSGWGRHTTANESTGSIGVQAIDAYGGVVPGMQSSVSFTGTSYARRSLTFVTPPCAARLRVTAQKTGGSGSFFIDDVSIGMTRNLAGNGDFESAGSQWTTSGTVSFAQSNAHSGTGALGLVAGSSVTQDIPCYAGVNYILSGWGRHYYNESTGSMSVQFLDSSGNVLAGSQPSVSYSGTTYTQKTLEFITPAAAAKIRVKVQKTGGVSYFYADDISLSTDQSLLGNGDFEGGNSQWTLTGAASVLQANANTGTWSLRLATGDTTYQDTPCSASTNYTLTGWGDHSANESTGSMKVQFLDSAGGVIDGTQPSISFAGTAYTWRSLTFTTPPNAAKIRITAQKTGGTGFFYMDDLLLATSRIVNNNVSIVLDVDVILTDYAGDLSLLPIKVELLQNGSVTSSKLITPSALTAKTAFIVTTPGDYTVRASAAGCLRQSAEVTAGAAGASVDLSLMDGDCNGDNEISTTDLSTVLRNLGKAGS